MKRGLLEFLLSILAVAGCGGGSTPPPPISVSFVPNSQSVDEGQSVTLTATVLNDARSNGVSWNVSCVTTPCGSLSRRTLTAAIYTAPRPVTAAMLVKITASAVSDSSKTASGTFTIVAAPSVMTTSLPSATGGAAYSATLQESGGIAPFSWILTAGSLPPGLNLNSDGTIAGTPTAGGNASFSVQLADSGNPPLTASSNLSIDVVVLPLKITTFALPDAAVDAPYKQSLAASGGIAPYTWTIPTGALPAWGALNKSSGVLSGIPNATGTDSFVVQVTDSQAAAASATQPLAITTVAAASANDSELNGQYAFLFNGFDDASGSAVALAGSFAADGKGKISGGIEDENGQSGSLQSVSFAGTYNVAADNRGAFTIVTASGSRTFSLVLSAISNGVAHQARFIEFDDATGTQGRRGSGILRKQDTSAFSQSKINGSYALGLQGQDSTGRREAMVGAFSASGSGTISSGVADQNIAGTTTNPSLSGSYAAPSPTSGRAVVLLSVSGSSNLNMSAYVVSATELFVMTTGDTASDGLLSGTILSRSSTPSDNSAFNAPAIYYEVASDPQTPTSPIAEVGLLRPDGNGNVSVELDRQAGRGILQDQTFAATYTVQPGSRVVMSGWSGDLTSPPRVLYLISKDTAFFLDESSQTGFGFVEVQTAPHSGGFSNSSLSGTFSMGTTFPPVSGNSNATGLATLDGAGTFTLFANVSTTSGWFVNQSTKGTYSITTQGRGVVTGLDVSTASINSWTLVASLFIAIPFVYGSRKRHNLRGRKTAFCLALWIVAVASPAGCPPPNTNQLVLYVVSPAKALMVNEQSLGGSPQITVLEQ